MTIGMRIPPRLLAIVGLLAWSGCTPEAPEDADRQRRRLEDARWRALTTQLAAKHGAATNWTSELPNRGGVQSTPYTVDFTKALVRPNGQPVLLLAALTDIEEVEGRLIALFSAADLIDYPFHLSLRLTVPAGQRGRILRMRAEVDGGHAVIARITRVSKASLRVHGENSEGRQVEADTYTTVFTLEGDLLEVVEQGTDDTNQVERLGQVLGDHPSRSAATERDNPYLHIGAFDDLILQGRSGSADTQRPVEILDDNLLFFGVTRVGVAVSVQGVATNMLQHEQLRDRLELTLRRYSIPLEREYVGKGGILLQCTVASTWIRPDHAMAYSVDLSAVESVTLQRGERSYQYAARTWKASGIGFADIGLIEEQVLLKAEQHGEAFANAFLWQQGHANARDDAK